jgi:prephenate dehydratase
MKTVAIQGQAGSFHEMAAQKYFGDSFKPVFCETFEDTFAKLLGHEVDYTLTAVGNSRYGDIQKVYDILIQNHLNTQTDQLWIRGEVYLIIEQCLLGTKGAELNSIKSVHSQAPALGQCQQFLHQHLPHAQLIDETDTAKSAELVGGMQDPAHAAIASRQAAQLHDLKIIEAGVQDDKTNTTRFVVIEHHGKEQEEATNKTSLLLRTTHQPGSLARALTLFGEANLNLSYLQSVPIPSQPFQYRFYIDIEAGANDERFVKIHEQLADAGYELDILGSYRSATIQ